MQTGVARIDGPFGLSALAILAVGFLSFAGFSSEPNIKIFGYICGGIIGIFSSNLLRFSVGSRRIASPAVKRSKARADDRHQPLLDHVIGWHDIGVERIGGNDRPVPDFREPPINGSAPKQRGQEPRPDDA